MHKIMLRRQEAADNVHDTNPLLTNFGIDSSFSPDSSFQPSAKQYLVFCAAPLRSKSSCQSTETFVHYWRYPAPPRSSIVRGEATDLKTDESHRAVDVLPTVEAALRDQKAGATSVAGYVFPNAIGGALDLTNIRNRIWYPALEKAGLRRRDLYQTRHTFASLILQSGEDPNWIARMMGHANTRTLHERYSAFIQHRTRQDGAAYLNALRQYDKLDEDSNSLWIVLEEGKASRIARSGCRLTIEKVRQI